MPKITKNGRSRNGRRQSFKKIDIHPETQRWIFIICLFALAGISLLGLFNLAGAAGQMIDNVLTLFLGWGKYIVPFILLIWAYALLNKKLHIKTISYVGLILLILSLPGLLHLIIPIDQASTAIENGHGGGWIGWFVSSNFQGILGLWASLIALLSIFIISILLILNTSIEDLKESRTILGRIIQKIQIWYYNWKLKMGQRPEDEEESSFAEASEDNDENDEEDDDEPEDAKEVSFAAKKLVSKNKDSAPEEIKLDEPKTKRVFRKIDLPSDLLDGKIGKPSAGNIAQNKLIIQKTLESFGIPVEMGDIAVGPTVTQFTLKPAEGVKLSRITALHDDLALALAAHPLRIEAPIPGKSLVGIEVPNLSVAIVHLRELLESTEFKNRKSHITIPLGRDVAGNTWIGDLHKMPHLLVAGQTGSGKSVALHSIIVSLLYQNGPETLKLILIDPKRVEMPLYNDIPHLLTPVITDMKKTVNSLKWLIAEMDRRYIFLEKLGKRNITDFNAISKEKMPFIVFVVDEMADLMSSMGNEVEGLIIRLAQMSRAVGIHLILATQRPSVEVITGLIKANIPARIAFAVSSITDSRTILDYGGAEKLIGRGDMLYTSAELSKPKRLQGAFLSDVEINKVVNYLKQSGEKPEYEQAVVEKQKSIKGDGTVDFSDPDEGDELFEEAKEVILQAGKASTSFLQRRLKVGYARAARLMDLMEEAGLVGPPDGAKPREILVAEKEVDEDEGQLESGVVSADDEVIEADDSEDFEDVDGEEEAREIERNNE